ncbi:MAG: hypothetical protein JO020_21695 [Chloroflexi bacterium]|nr:hypothetical protein [Chloroflexota bacterium]
MDLSAEGGRAMFAATSVGVFRSRDGGLTWRPPASAGLPPLAEGLALSPDFPRDRTVYACAVDGLYRSTDAGDSWQPILVGSRMLSVACLDAGVVLAGTEDDGVLRSADGGRTWASASGGLLDLGAICLAARGELAFAGTQGGLHRSRNSGQAWRAVGPQTPIQCVAISANGGLVLVGTEGDGLFRSTDDGTTWQAVDADDCQTVSALAIAADRVVVATSLSIAVSHDAGVTWRITPSPGVVFAVAISREGLLAGLHQGGLVRSVDDGATWSPPHVDLNARLICAATFAQGGTLYVADIDAGLRVSHDAGRSWRPISAGIEPPSAMAIGADHVLFASNAGGVYVSQPGAETWNLLVPSSVFDGAEITALAPTSEGRLFVAARGEGEATVWRSTASAFERYLAVPSSDRPQLSTAPDGTVFAAVGSRIFNLADSSEVPFSRGIITSLAVQDHAIFLGTAGGVCLSQDGAQTFVDWSEGLPAGCRVVALGALDDGVYAITFGGQVWRRKPPTAPSNGLVSASDFGYSAAPATPRRDSIPGSELA